jgi:hypothetical protein
VVLQGETGNLVGTIELVNRGVLACSLAGRPRLRLIGASDAAGMRAQPLHGLTPEPGIPYPSLRALQPGEKAGMLMSWGNWCGPAPRAVQLVLQRLVETVRIQPAGARPRCDVPAKRAYLAAGPLQPLASTARTHILLPLAAEIVDHVTFGAKTAPGVVARPGAVATFLVALTNTSHRPFAFGHPCPLFLLGVGGHTELYRLNCRLAGTIAPGERAVFEMKAAVPKTARPGRLSLTWSLAPLNTTSPFAGGVVVVRGS